MILDFDILAWSLGIVLLILALGVLRKWRSNLPYLLFFSAFWFYILLLLKVAVFSIPLARGISEETIEELMPVMLSVTSQV